VTLMLRCSLSPPPSARGAAAPFGEPLSDMIRYMSS
jgi:hypothetical protein